MDGTIHVSNKNRRYVISKEISMSSVPTRSSILPLAPVAGEDEEVAKKIAETLMLQKQKEESKRKLQEKIARDEERNRISKERQEFHKNN